MLNTRRKKGKKEEKIVWENVKTTPSQSTRTLQRHWPHTLGHLGDLRRSLSSAYLLHLQNAATVKCSRAWTTPRRVRRRCYLQLNVTLSFLISGIIHITSPCITEKIQHGRRRKCAAQSEVHQHNTAFHKACVNLCHHSRLQVEKYPTWALQPKSRPSSPTQSSALPICHLWGTP